jgi:hypothetical protein
MILILTREHIIPHFRYELLSNLDAYHLRVNSDILSNAKAIVLKIGDEGKILKTTKTTKGMIYPWDICVKYLLEL